MASVRIHLKIKGEKLINNHHATLYLSIVMLIL